VIRRLAFALAAALLALAAVVVYLGSADLGRFKNQLTPLVSKSLGRELRIEGRLSLRLGRSLRLQAAGVSVANAPWADEPYLFEADGLAAEVDLVSLIRGPVRIESLALTGAVIRLQQTEDGRRNWSPPGADAAEPAATDRGGLLRSLRRIARFDASDVRLLVTAALLSEPEEIVIDNATYSFGDELMSADVSATVNGIPLVLATDIAPADIQAAPEALSFLADARMGEVALNASALLANPDTLAFSAADFRLEGPDIDYLLEVLNLPKITSGPLDVRAKLTPDPERSGFDADGRVGAFRFAANGWLNDLTGSGGFDIALRLSGESLSDLGRAFTIDGLPELPFDVDGALRSRAQGLEFNNTRVAIGDETLEAEGTVVWPGGRGGQLDLRAGYGGLSARLTMAGFAGPQNDMNFGLSLAGDDAGETAGRLGLDQFDGLPFTLTGEGSLRGRSLTLRDTQLRVGEQAVMLSGRAELDAQALDFALDFDAAAVDLSPWLPNNELLPPALSTITGTGRLLLNEGRLDAQQLALRAGNVSLDGRLGLPLGEAGRAGEFALHLRAPSADALLPDLTGAALSAEPVDLQGDGSWDPDGWRLDDLLLRTADSGNVRGSVSFAAGARPSVSARLTSDRLELPRVRTAGQDSSTPTDDGRAIPAWEIPLATLPALDADLQLEIDSLYGAGMGGESVLLAARLRDDRLVVDSLETRGPRGRIDAALSVEPDAATGYTLTLDVTGRELAIAAPDEPVAALADRPRSEVSIALRAQGADLRALAASLDGRIRVESGPGTIPRRGGVLVTLVFEDVLSSTLETINPLVKERNEAQMNCFALVADIDAGKVRGDPLVAMQTTELNLLGWGEIDLGEELLDLDIAAQPLQGLGINLGDLINPFTRLGGTLASPRIVADPGTALVEIGAGIATAGLSVIAKKLRDRFLAGNPCAKALKEFEKNGDG